MDEQLECYRNKHASKYHERIKEQEKIYNDFENYVVNLENCISILALKQNLRDIIETLKKSDLVKDQIKKKYNALDIVNKINNNATSIVDFSNPDDRIAVMEIKDLMKELLDLFQIYDDIDIEISMDCSKDEEIARQLAQLTSQLQEVLPTPTQPPTRRGRRRRQTPESIDQ